MKHLSVSMESLVRKQYLRSRGYAHVGDSAVPRTSPQFDKHLLRRLQEAEKTEEVVIGEKISFYAIFPEEEKMPETLREGIRIEIAKIPAISYTTDTNNSSSKYKIIAETLPSQLLHELDKFNVLYENVTEFYLEVKTEEYKQYLDLEDILTLRRMESGKTLDYSKLSNKTVSEEDRIARKSLDNRLRLSNLVVMNNRNLFTLSSEATKGTYHAVVDKKYLP